MDNRPQYSSELKDPRVDRAREHLPEEILLLAIAAMLSGAGNWNDVEDDGEAK